MKGLTLSVKEMGEIRVVEFVGNLDTNTAREAEEQFNDLFNQGERKIVVNFQGLEYISSAGLRVLLATAKKLKGASGEFRICHLNDTVQEVFDISGFSTILQVVKSETEALDSLRS